MFVLSFLILVNCTFLFSQEMEEPKEEKKLEKKEEKKEEKIITPKVEKAIEQKEEKMEEMIGIKEEIPERLKFYKEKYELKVPAGGLDIIAIYDICIKALEDGKCQVANKTLKPDEKNNGLNKGKIESDFCVFANGKDETFDTLQKYSFKMPVIRGGIWINGRMQYKIYLKEYDDGAVDILIKGEISGMESFVTNEIHFWKSNGMFETTLLEAIKQKLGIK